MQKWEHTWLSVTATGQGELKATVGGKELDHAEVCDRIRNLGEQGWEMVAATPAMQSRVATSYIESGPVEYAIPQTVGYVLWFKRPHGGDAAPGALAATAGV